MLYDSSVHTEGTNLGTIKASSLTCVSIRMVKILLSNIYTECTLNIIKTSSLVRIKMVKTLNHKRLRI
jgi:hypothetical protein